MSIHHAVTKKANKAGIVVREPEHGFWTASKDGKEVNSTVSAKDALDKLLGEAKPVKEPKAAKPKSVITAKYKKRYKPNKDTCGDPLVEALFTFLHPDGEDTDAKLLVKLAKDNGIDFHAKWGHLKLKSGEANVGMQRMNLGNVLRGMVRRSIDVKIGATTIPGAKKPKKD